MDEHTTRAGDTRGPLIILNASANSGRAAGLEVEIRGILETLGRDAEVVQTRSADEARRIIQEAARQQRGPIVACGGDGTVRSAATSLLDIEATIPLAILPLGTANDYAYNTLNLPRDMKAALEVALDGEPRKMDVAHLNDGWLVNAFGSGLDGNVAWDVHEMVEAKRPWAKGPARYAVSIINQLMLHYDRLPVLDITIDGRKLDRRQMLIAAVMIGPTTGGGFKMAPEADPCDGKLDVLLMRKMSRFKALMVMQLTKAGRHTGVRGVKMLRAQEISISSERTVQAHADGELVSATSFDIRVKPGALTVMCPR
ncbi:MAG TPA: diacylglycerol kinase family protein [Chloroflexia bacterium]|nr:diacylglycerol kinase family protein [Chloroflexia bacterium]